ncbi:MAG: acyl-CoA thioesterase [Actinomycetota bacterium]|jgi:acyl-CoA thioester hydrolase|nr:acyl-CoA thioesterase [Actinomycetota bacterium]
MTVPAFSTDVAVRWSDMDLYGHVNNARVVTLLEEARTELLFGEGARRGVEGLIQGVVVVKLEVCYRRPLVYSATPVRVRLWISELRAASFAVDYVVSTGDGDAVTARTWLAPYDTKAQRPRRLMPVERDFLAAFREGGLDG